MAKRSQRSRRPFRAPARTAASIARNCRDGSSAIPRRSSGWSSIVHPLVRAAQARFLADAERSGAPVAVLDVPLLFETGGDQRVDAVVVVSAPADVQRARTLDRAGMTAEKFDALMQKQTPDAEKRRRADFIVDTSQSFDFARAQVRAIFAAVRAICGRKGKGPDA